MSSMQRDVVVEYPFKNELKVPVAFFEQRKKIKSIEKQTKLNYNKGDV